MSKLCSDDPVACIDAITLFIGAFLSDWITLAMMAVLLGLLLKLRADQKKAFEMAYARQMVAYDEKRKLGETQSKTWVVGSGNQ